MDTAYYTLKDESYFSRVRRDIIHLLPQNPQQKIMEIGAGAGATLFYIKQHQLASEVTGVELLPMNGFNLDRSVVDHFHILDVEKEEIPAAKEYFDVIICADVLEHLSDPWTVLKKLSTHLKKGGVFILSLPNLREWKTLFPILFRGDFKYNPEGGIMDKTHLRFFCKKNILELVKSANLEPVYIKPNILMKFIKEARKRRMLNRLTLGLFTEFLAIQYLVIAKKN